MESKQVPLTFAFALTAAENDWSWIPYAPNVTENEYGSQLMIGNYDQSPWIDLNNPKGVLLTTTGGSGNWTFDLDNFKFGFTNETVDHADNTDSYVELSTEVYNKAWMTLSHPGIGLPSPMYEPFVETLQSVTGNIWNCKMRYGYFCYAPVTCETFLGLKGSSYNLTNYDFKVVFSSDPDNYIRVPLVSFMRNA